LLGGTGQGKTSFLNFLGNIEKALNNKDGIKNCQNLNSMKLESQVGGNMASKTSGCELYQVKIGKAKITVTDTPGFGDTRGV
jgi:septin family protein